MIWAYQSGVISSFHPHFAGKCDSQSRELTQLPISGYNFAIKPATNRSSSSCWMRTWDNVAEKYSKWSLKMFVLLLNLNPTLSSWRAIALPTRPRHQSTYLGKLPRNLIFQYLALFWKIEFFIEPKPLYILPYTLGQKNFAKFISAMKNFTK